MTTPFDDLAALERVAVNLFYGWGYNFYRDENLLRADSLTVRAKVGALLGQARGSVEAAESAHRRAKLPAPTREQPRPDPTALADAQRLESLSRDIGGLEGRIRAAPVPEADHMTNRYRRERETLERLVQADLGLAGRADLLRSLIEGKDAAAILAGEVTLRAGLAALARALSEREALLMM